ncbi:MAG: H/ACA ribonucleoprotein complex subunit GAR1 [Methermicoccaceae archaeon]
MKRLGVVVCYSGQGNLVVKLEGKEPPSVGSMALSGTNQNIGKISDVFGPVSAPYIAIRPFRRKDAMRLVGKRLYAR